LPPDTESEAQPGPDHTSWNLERHPDTACACASDSKKHLHILSNGGGYEFFFFFFFFFFSFWCDVVNVKHVITVRKYVVFDVDKQSPLLSSIGLLQRRFNLHFNTTGRELNATNLCSEVTHTQKTALDLSRNVCRARQGTLQTKHSTRQQCPIKRARSVIIIIIIIINMIAAYRITIYAGWAVSRQHWK
jgi:hypothetical protein